MISIEQINGEIAVLEEEHPTHVVMQKLASLYIVRDHLSIGEPTPITPYRLPDTLGDSEFLSQVKVTDMDLLWDVMDDLMNTISVLNPKLYDGVMQKLRGGI